MDKKANQTQTSFFYYRGLSDINSNKIFRLDDFFFWECGLMIQVKDIMVQKFDTINEDSPIEQAIEMILNGKVRETGHKTVSLLVVNDFNQLVGVITMFDILYHFRPDFLNFGFDGDELDWKGQMKNLVTRLKEKKVKQVMSKHVLGADKQEHLMVVIDRMVKNKFRRLPVLENGKPVGVVYISDIYAHLFTNY